MTTYIVTFEVADNLKKNQLEEKLKQYSRYCAINDNCWVIVSDQTPVQIRDFLSSVISESDRIFVIRSGTHSAWKNSYGKKYDNWLKDKL